LCSMSDLLKRAVVSAETERWHRSQALSKQQETTAQSTTARTCWLTAVASMGRKKMLERNSALLSNLEPKVVHRRVRHLLKAQSENRSILQASHGR
jgi:hypothetical protein